MFFDGGYKVNVGGGTSNEAQYRSSITSCGDRAVYDVDMIAGGPDALLAIPGISMDERDRNFYYDYFVMRIQDHY